MTKEDVEKIQSESIHAVELLFSKGPTYPESYCELFERAAAYGHNLAMERMEQYATQKALEIAGQAWDESRKKITVSGNFIKQSPTAKETYLSNLKKKLEGS